MSALRDLREELRRRAAVLRELPRDLCPENKVTPQLAGMAHLGLEPVVFGIDECQVLFTDPEHGKDAETICTDLIKRGPAVGINLVLATQRPDAKSLPTGISGNAGTRFCLRVMGQQENDMVLGTSMYRNGIRATMFNAAAKGVGWLVGALDEPTVVATSYVDGPAAARVVARAVELRGGPVLAEAARERAHAYSLLEDLRAVWPDGEEAAWSELLLERLQLLRPEHYARWDVRGFGAAARAAGVPVVSVHRKLDGKGVTKYGVRLAALLAAIEARPGRRGDSRGPAIDSGGASPPEAP
jgi:S-DNA-T family DNA segregation ATPase FtsK/SpoIIIE